MYHKQKRMAGGAASDSADGFRLRFVERVVSLPAVTIACNVAFQTYKNIKVSNKLLGFTLNTAEKAGSFVTQKSVPVIRRFEDQIKAVDNIACRGLENLVEKVPLIAEQPEQVLNYGRHRYNETVQNSLDKLTTSKNYVKGLVDSEIQKRSAHLAVLLSTSPGQRVVQLSDHLLDQIEAYINYYYPPPQNEESEEAPVSQPKLLPWTRAKNLSKLWETRISMKFDRDLRGAKQFVTNAYSNVVHFNLTKSIDEFLTSPFGSLLLNSVDSAFDHADNYVDYYLPPLGDEGSDQPFGDREMLPAWRRADMLSNTLRERIYKHSLLQLQKLHLQGRETAVRMKNSVVVQFMSSVNLSVSMILSESSEYAISVFRFAYNFKVTGSSRSVARLRDLARATVTEALETARGVRSHPEHTMMNMTLRQSSCFGVHQSN